MKRQRCSQDLERILKDLAGILRKLLVALGDAHGAGCVGDVLCRLDVEGQRLAVVRASSVLVEGLSRRQSEVLWMVGEGKSTKEIARELGVTASCVKKHLNVVHSKIGSENRALVVRLAMLVDPPA